LHMDHISNRIPLKMTNDKTGMHKHFVNSFFMWVTYTGETMSPIYAHTPGHTFCLYSPDSEIGLP
jgi:hypothetical protein